MTALTLFWLLLSLTLGIWGCLLVCFWYGHQLLKQQEKYFTQLTPYLKKIQKDQDTLKSLTMSDDMPLSKLKNITLPDNVQVNFTHKKTKV